MTATIPDISQRRAALIAGFGLLIIVLFAVFGDHQRLIVQGDAAATVNNIIAHETAFRIGIVSWLIVAVCDIVVAWALYVLLKPVNRSLSLLAAWFRLAYAAVLAAALNNLFGVLRMLKGADYSAAFETKQLHVQAMAALDAFTSGWDYIGLVIFGLHLLVLGYLVFKSGFIPKWLGILLIVASAGYMIDSFGRLLVPGYKMSVTMFTFFGELVLMVWLLWKGGLPQQALSGEQR